MNKPNVHAVHRDWDRPFPVIQRAKGIYLYDEQGNKYLDGSGGSSVVTSIGHGVDAVRIAMDEQAQKFSFYPAHAFTNKPFLELSDLIVSLSPGKLKDNSRVWVTCTGTDATDDAVRLARQYWVEANRPSKHLVITRWQSFHGNNIAVAGFSGLSARRKIFQPMYVDSPHIAPAFCYRCYFEKTYPECSLLCARSLETAIRQHGPENIAAFIAEPVVGAALGCCPAPEGYFQIIREICDNYEVLFIADEVMTGWGRTGKMWGVDHWEVTPDIIATAKGMTAGYTPLSAIIAREDIWSVLQENHSPFKAGHTLNANAVSCAGAIAVIDYMLENRLTENACLRGMQALAGLEMLKEKHPSIGDVRGLGLMFGFEFVSDKQTKQAFPSALKISMLLEEAALKRGLVTYPCTGTLNGDMGDMVLLAPPLIIDEEQMNDLIGILDASIGEVEQQLGLSG
jgi:adenosylmethionine-8-amino-7-oxononanoate aminotransferase